MGGECKLLEGFFAWSVQVLLFFMAIGALIVKRQYFEHPQRTMQIWLMDVGKQSSAAGFAHVLNLLTAYLLYKSEEGVSDQCAWYFLNYFIDTTLGIPIAWFYLSLLTTVASRFDWYRIAHTGDYGNPPSYKTWMYQILAWEFVVLLMKGSLAMVLYAFRHPLSIVGNWVSRPIADSPELELLLVMVACPCIMNMVQFWIFDSLLKMKYRAAGIEPITLQIASDEMEDRAIKKGIQINIHPPIELSLEHGSRLKSFLNKVKKGKKEEARGLMNNYTSPSKDQDDEALDIPKHLDSSLHGEKATEEQITSEMDSEEDEEVDLLLETEEEEQQHPSLVTNTNRLLLSSQNALSSSSSSSSSSPSHT